jgi:competence protein ComEA
VIVLAAVLAVTGWLVVSRWGGGSHAPPEVTLPRARPTAAPSNGADAADQQSGPLEVTVHAAGAVVHAGVYRLTAGARVTDLLAAAGGAAPDADVDALNLAARVDDGERVYVPHRGEVPAGALAAGDPSDGGRASNGAPDPPVDLNTATLTDLDALPGVGPATAQAILDHRRSKGRFRSVDELLEVRGIGPSRLQALRKRVRV